MCGRFGVKEGAHRERGSKGSGDAVPGLSAGFGKVSRVHGVCPDIQGLSDPELRSFIGPLQIRYSPFMEKGVLWSHRAFRGAGVVWGTRHQGSGMKVYRRETGIRCRHALADSRGNRALVYGVGALELVERSATSGVSPDPVIRRFRPPSTRLVMSATEAEPITVRLSPNLAGRETTGRRTASVHPGRTLTR